MNAALVAELDAEARAILHWWARHAVDEAHGGFVGEIDADNRPVSGAAKGAVLNARLLWFFSTAAERLRCAEAAALADRAADYLWTHFYDADHGGLFWALESSGLPRETRKQAYAQAFAIYGFCAHARARANAAALARATELFRLLETRFADAAHGGYVEALGADWRPLADMRLSAVDRNTPKTANTHLHILEAYAALHELAPSVETEAALRRTLTLFLDRFVDAAAGRLRLFLELDWTDRTDFISFGHEIEASWLIWEACRALNDDAIRARAAPLVLALARASLAEARDGEGGIVNERAHDGALDARRVWWVQAEAMIGFLNAYEITGAIAFYDAFAQAWDFVKRRQRDDARGEWLWWSKQDAPDPDRRYKAGFWKCPYHNGRAMFECATRLVRLGAQSDGR